MIVPIRRCSKDLDDRGMLDDTLVAGLLSEFGRTPKVNPAGGAGSLAAVLYGVVRRWWRAGWPG